MLQVLREDQHAARCWLVPHLGGTSWEERGGAAVGLWHVVQVKLHCDLRGVSSPRMPFRAAVAAVKVRVKGLTRRVAEEAQALVQLHQAPAIIQLLWQVGPQQLQQPVCQLLAVNDDSVAVPHFWHELLLAVANVEQGRCEALGIHLRKERRALFLSQGTPQHPREAALARALAGSGRSSTRTSLLRMEEGSALCAAGGSRTNAGGCQCSCVRSGSSREVNTWPTFQLVSWNRGGSKALPATGGRIEASSDALSAVGGAAALMRSDRGAKGMMTGRAVHRSIRVSGKGETAKGLRQT
eukprot:CAMPEP_0171193548 /NCGR_PEP_ID=MMETSP0790-20130122/20435_1 /TAXON_ID=2925 /ORGANISM="Alexandrium catenella, Strain OF101" /LENGTH=296 /DNA_ID=CAMNT_0011658727 /DNA_START=260 /DNA_END=1151 /DNA_ORIENTATION=-